MKALRKPFALFLAAVCLGAVSLRAEGDDKKPDGPKRGEKRERPGRGDKERGPKLTEEEKAKLKAAHEVAEKDPEFIKARDAAKAAHDKAKESKSPEDRKAAMEAGKAAREAHKAAMITADPSVAEILKKRPERPFRRGEEGPGEKGPGEHKRGPKRGGDKPADAPEKPDDK